MAEVRIGDDCVIGLNVGLYTGGHASQALGFKRSHQLLYL